MARSDKGMVFFFDWREPFETLTGNECKTLLLAMLDYCQNGIEPPKFKGKAAIVASFVFPFLKRSKQNAEAGKRGMNKRYNDVNNKTANNVNNSDITAIGNQDQDKTKTINQDKTKTINQDYNQDKNITPACNGGEAASRFEAFWESYPRKIGKATARAAFEKLNPDSELFDTIMRALESHKRSVQWTKDGGQYIPNPTTWIDQMRWEDELPAPEPNHAFSSFDTDEFFEVALAASIAEHQKLHQKLIEEGKNHDKNGE